MRIPPAKIYFPEDDKREILQRIEEILSSGWLTMGEIGREFERQFASYTGSANAIAVNSGTSALEIPLRILGVKGKEVLVPSNTFFATPAAVLHAGGRVRFVDIDPNTLALDVESLKKNITPETVGVIVVHIAGIITPQIGEIQSVCQERNLFLLEDAAHAHGSTYNGRHAGTFGKASAFSFYPTKVITSGEGGMIVTDSEKIRDEAIIYRDQGKAGFTNNHHVRLGYNWRMSELHAVVGLVQLGRLEEFIEGRTRVARIYDEGLRVLDGVSALSVPDACRSNYYKYVAFLDPGFDRGRLKAHLRERYEVRLSGEVYELPCHEQPVFKEAAGNGFFPVAEDICKRHICLPIFSTMTEEEAEYVLSSLEKALQET